MSRPCLYAPCECSPAMLGTLHPPPLLDGDSVHEYSDPAVTATEAVIHGVTLPRRVIEELREFGIALSWYSPSELEDAVHACAVDGQLVEDEYGVDLNDKMHLSDAEKRADAGDIDGDQFRLRRQAARTGIPKQFGEKILKEREDPSAEPFRG